MIEQRIFGGVPVLFDKPEIKCPTPLIILAHGFTRSKEDWRGRIPDLVGRGYAVAALDNRGHGNRGGPDIQARASRNGIWNLRAIRQMILETGEDIQTLIDSALEREPIDPSRIGLAGVSMGAFASLKAAVGDDRIRAVASIIGSPFWDDVFAGAVEERDPEQRRILQAFAEKHQPASFPDRFFPRAILFQNGGMDPHLECARVKEFCMRLAESYAAAPERLGWVEFPEVVHEFLPAMWDNAVQWFDRFL